MRTSGHVPRGVPATARTGYIDEAKKEVSMLLALAVILLILAIGGGLAIHPLLFLIAILAVFAFFGGRRGTLR